MRLFLSSENLGDYQDEFLSLLEGVKLAYIGNAKDYLSDKDRNEKVLEHQEQFENLGLSFTEIDLRDFFEEKVPDNILEDFDGIWCAGGNTFLLRSAMYKSGFDNILVEAIQNDSVVYGGSSAGAVIAGPTLRGTDNGDNPDLVEQIYEDEVNWNGLNLIDYVVIPHCGSEWFGVEASKMEKFLSTEKIQFKKLSDGQVIIVNDNRVDFMQ
jgi:dipeptidase E